MASDPTPSPRRHELSPFVLQMVDLIAELDTVPNKPEIVRLPCRTAPGAYWLVDRTDLLDALLVAEGAVAARRLG